VATKTFPVTSSAVRFRNSKEDHPRLAGALDYIITRYGDGGTYVADLKCAISSLDWADVIQVTAAQLVLVTPDDASTAIDGGLVKPIDNSDAVLTLLTSPFPDNSATNFGSLWTSSPQAPSKGTLSKTVTIRKTVDYENRIDIRRFLQRWAPKTVKINLGTTANPNVVAGRAEANHGLELTKAAGKENVIVVTSERHPDTAIQPRIEITYTAKPAPGSLFITAPPTVITQIEGHDFEADYIAGRTSDRLALVQVQLYKATVVSGDYDDAGTHTTWKYSAPASASDAATGHFVVPIPASLKSGTAYKWRTRARNQNGEWTPWTSAVSLSITTNNPTLASLKPVTASSVPTLNHVSFGATYSDPDSNKLLSYRIQLRSQTLSSDPAWDETGVFWDTSDRTPTATEIATGVISTLYDGEALLAGTYSWRIKATDILGADSPWYYADITTTQDEEADPGETEFLTGYASRHGRARILIKSMGANRGPGTTIATIEDAGNVGASEMHNAPGEFFFTIPARHPQVSVIEPWQVHYAVEEYRGEGWKETAAGLITDFDASDNDVVFYGTDYLGLLELTVENRFNPNSSPNKAASLYPTDPTGATSGAMYSDKTIKQVVQDQIDRAIHGTNSPVGFITRGAIATMNEKVTIYATFKSRLSFIAGLLDSHRGSNLGLKTRIRVRKTVSGGYTFVVEDNPGKDRSNLALEYGKLVEGFRVVPFGDWGSRVYAIGRALNGIRVEYLPDVLGVASEATYGRIPKVNMWQDVTDRTDLKRRAALYARQVSKVGKRLALALRVDSLGVKDGWDICDSVYVNINRGVVNTLNSARATGRSGAGRGGCTRTGTPT
jgi:hypothetical protein